MIAQGNLFCFAIAVGQFGNDVAVSIIARVATAVENKAGAAGRDQQKEQQTADLMVHRADCAFSLLSTVQI